MFSHSPEAGDPGAGRAGPLQLGGGVCSGPLSPPWCLLSSLGVLLAHRGITPAFSMWECLCRNSPLSKDTSPVGLQPALGTSSCHVCSSLISHEVAFWGAGVRNQKYGFGSGGRTSTHSSNMIFSELFCRP